VKGKPAREGNRRSRKGVSRKIFKEACEELVGGNSTSTMAKTFEGNVERRTTQYQKRGVKKLVDRKKQTVEP